MFAQQYPAEGQPFPPPPTGPGTTEEAAVKRLHALYLQCVKPLEDMYRYEVFQPSWFEETLLNSRPLVTVFGPWSAGKTTFINYLLQGEHMPTGSQPTTSAFTAIMQGAETKQVDGRALANMKNMPFRGLAAFGEEFLENFRGYEAPHPLLGKVTLIDTPGVLEGEQRVQKRPYEYAEVCRWFADRSDLVLVLFDPARLESGTELHLLFAEALQGCLGRTRIILNKADSLDSQAVMRVYGRLMWTLSSVIRATEPPRVYIGSFSGRPYLPGSFTPLFAAEKADLLREIVEVVPQQAWDRKVSQVIRRAKDVLAHAAIVGSMRADLPMLFGRKKAKQKALENLPRTYETVAAKYKLQMKDFAPLERYRQFLTKFDLDLFPEIGKAERHGLLIRIQRCIDTTLPAMFRSRQPSSSPLRAAAAASPSSTLARRLQSLPPPEVPSAPPACAYPLPAAPPQPPGPWAAEGTARPDDDDGAQPSNNSLSDLFCFDAAAKYDSDGSEPATEVANGRMSVAPREGSYRTDTRAERAFDPAAKR